MPMHGQPLEKARVTGFTAPPPRKVRSPIVDMHTHMAEPARNHELVEAARLYGIARVVAIVPLDQGLALMRRWPDEIAVAARPIGRDRARPEAVAEAALRVIHEAHAHGVRIIKFWFAPRIRDRLPFLLDSPHLDRAFDAIAEHRMGVLVHVGDPDRWFERKYDPRKYGTKADQYPMLEARLRAYPSVPFLAAHMGGDPEHLDHLGALLQAYPNLYLDTSATKWIVRELGRQRRAARAFLREWAERICFGTDQVVVKNPEPHRYPARYWVHQMFWETDLECRSPLPDEDSDGPPVLRGLDLPADVLEQIYWKNAKRAFDVSARSATAASPAPQASRSTGVSCAPRPTAPGR